MKDIQAIGEVFSSALETERQHSALQNSSFFSFFCHFTHQDPDPADQINMDPDLQHYRADPARQKNCNNSYKKFQC
jgi:hypothetical protein